jgi:hypothetical protein
MNSEKIRLVEHMTRIQKILHIGLLRESQKERDQQEDLELGLKIILKIIFKNGMLW